MQQQTPPVLQQYRRPARVLHWIMAAIVITMVPLGIAVNYLPWDAFQDWLFNLHKSLGIVVLGPVIVRLAYRLTHSHHLSRRRSRLLSDCWRRASTSSSTSFSSPCR